MIKLLSLGIVIFGILFLFRINQIGGIDPTYSDPEIEVFKPLRNYLSSVIDQIAPFPQSSILQGILIGDGSKIPGDLKKQLQATSTIHLVVVSGQNLTIFSGFIMNLVYLIGRRKTIILATLAIIFYCLLTGFQVPVIRAGIMALVTFIGQFIGKEKVGWWVLLLTAGVMLLYNPNWIQSISFQLSFMATVGVVVVAPLFLRYLKVIPNILREDLAVTIAAYLLTLPIIAFNFHQISLVGIISNALIVWTSPATLITGFISLVFGVINISLGSIFALIPISLVTYFLYIVQFFSNFPGSVYKVGETATLMWAGYYLLLASLFWALKINSQKKVVED